MRLGILCPLFGDRPNAVREIELLPLQTSDFLSALSGECQKFNDNPIWSADTQALKQDTKPTTTKSTATNNSCSQLAKDQAAIHAAQSNELGRDGDRMVKTCRW